MEYTVIVFEQLLLQEILLVLFDDQCGFCYKFISMLKRASQKNNKNIQFISLQKTLENLDLVNKYSIPQDLDTIIVLKNDKQFQKSEAICLILTTIGGRWWLIGKLIKLFPKFIRDFFYSKVARIRYNICGIRRE